MKILIYSFNDKIGDGLQKITFLQKIKDIYPNSIIYYTTSQTTTLKDKLNPLVKDIIHEFIENNILPYNLPILKVERFLQLLLGLESKNLQDEEIGLKVETKGSDDYASEVTLLYKDLNLLMKVKKIWKNY